MYKKNYLLTFIQNVLKKIIFNQEVFRFIKLFLARKQIIIIYRLYNKY